MTTFPMTRPSKGAIWAGTPFLLLFLTVAVASFYIPFSGKNVELDEGALTITGPLYSDCVAREDLVLERVAAVDLDSQAQLSPVLRTGGIEVFGYKEGWFELQNGEKAFLLVMDPSSVVYIPTRRDHSLLVSVQDPKAFIAALKPPADGR